MLINKNVPTDLKETVTIIDAVEEYEKHAIYEFRYRIQVQEMQRKIPYADHVKKIIFDPLDLTSHHAYAVFNNEIVGVVRIVTGSASDFPTELKRVFNLDKYDEFNPGQKNMCFATKLMVDERFRRTPLSFRLMAKSYELSRKHDIQFSFSGSNPYLIPIYEQLGYFQIGQGFQDPGYGFIVPTLLITEDLPYMEKIHSPYLRIARKLPFSMAASNWVRENIPGLPQYPVTLISQEGERWEYVFQRLGNPVLQIPLLKSFNTEEAAAILNSSSIIGCRRHTQFLQSGDICNEINILLTGQMIINDGQGYTGILHPGDIIGSCGLTTQTHHSVNTYAVTYCEVLCLSRFSYEKLQRTIAFLAQKLNSHLELKGGLYHE